MPESSLNAGIVIGAALGRTFGSTFKSVEQRSKKLGDALKKARLGTALTGDVVKYKQQLDQLRRKQAQAGGAGKKLTQQIAKAERQYRAAGQRAKRYGVEIGQAARRHREFSRTARDASRQLGRLQRQQREQSRMRQQAGGPRRIGTAVGLLGAGYAAGRIFRTSMGLEEQAIRLDTVINAEDGDTEAAVQRSVQHAREVARRTLSSEAELLEIQYELNSASLSESAARAGSEVVSKVATVTKGDVGQVGKILGGVFNNLGDTIEGSNVEEKLGRIGDVLTRVQFKFALSDFGQLGEGLAESAASASANRLSLERLGVAIGILNTAQVTGSRAGTAMNAVLRQMPKASEELGFTIQRNAEGNLNLGATLEGLRNSLSVYDDLDERNQVIQQLFGDEGMRGIIPLLEGVEQYKKGLESVGEAGGLVDKSYQKFLQSSGGDWKMLTQNVTAVSSTIGGTLLPAISAVLWPFGVAARVVGGLVDRFPVLGHVIGGVTVSIVGLMATGLATSYVSSLWNRFMDSNTLASRTMGAALNWTRARLVAFNRTALVTAARTKALAVGGAIQSFGSSLIGLATRAIPVAIGGLRALSVAALSNPIVLIGVAVAGAAIVVYKYWGPIKGFFKGLWGGIKTIFSAAWEGIKGFFLNYHPVGLVIKHWAPIVGFFGRLWTGIQSVFSSAWEGIKGFFLPVGLVIKHWAPIVGFFGRLWTGIQSVFSSAWEGIKGFFLPVGLVIKHWAPIVGFFGRLWTGIQSVFSSAWEGIKGFFLPVGLVIKHWAPIVGFFGRLWTGIQSVFSSAWEGIKGFFLPVGLVIKHWAPIVGFFGRLWTGIQSVFSSAWEGIKGFFLPVGLVIKHWAPIVGFFGRLWTGIQSVFSSAWEGIKGLFLNYHPVGLVIKHWAPIVGFFGRLWTGIQSVFSSAWEGIKGLFLNYHPVGLVIKHWAPIVGFFGRLWTGIQSVFSSAWEGIKGFFLPVGLVIKHWAPIVGFFGRLWTGIQSVFSSAWEGIKGLFLNYHPVGLVIKHWAPIVGFFGRLWTGIQSVFSSAWQGVVDWFGSLSLFDAGVAIFKTLGEGIGSAVGWLGDKVKGVFGSIRKLLPFSDAKEGPLSGLTKSGQSILGTLGEGIRQAGPVALQRPLARTLGAATAGLALTLPIAASPAATSPTVRPSPVVSFDSQTTRAAGTRPASTTIHYHNQITIHQQPNEDPQALAERILREMTRLQKQRRREEVYDGL